MSNDLQGLPERVSARFRAALGCEPALGPFVSALLHALRACAPSGRLFVSGGLVRDLVVSIVHGGDFRFKDLDLVVEGASHEQVGRVLAQLQAGSDDVVWQAPVGESFPVWKVKLRDHPDNVDVALVRTERSFGSGHRDFAVATEGVTVEQDAQRRDFDMNAMYVEFLSGGHDQGARFHDFEGGAVSIAKKRIRCVGDPQERFHEDPLRILRAVRFRSSLKGFAIEEETSRAMSALSADLLPTVSRERIADELRKAVVADARVAMEDLERYGILSHALPDLSELARERRQRTASTLSDLVASGPETLDAALVFAALLLEVAAEDIEHKMRGSLGLSKVAHGYLRSQRVTALARSARLPSVKDIGEYCHGALVLSHLGMVEHRGAVLEQVLSSAADPSALLALHGARCRSVGETSEYDPGLLPVFPASRIPFREAVATTGIPTGAHLSEIKLAVRQAEIESRIDGPAAARKLVRDLYARDHHLVREHVEKVRRLATARGAPGAFSPDATLVSEIRWLLLSRPAPLLRAYVEHGVLESVLPELAAADAVVEGTRHHFVRSYIDDVTLALSMLYEEREDPTPAQVLSVLLLDVGKPATKNVSESGRVTYHGHEVAGAALAGEVCRRLGIGEPATSDVVFIVRNHNALVLPAGPNRIRRLTGRVDDALIDDLLLVHKVDQLAKMRIESGRRMDDGQLDNWNTVMNHLDAWRAAAAQQRRRRVLTSRRILSSRDLMVETSEWGSGMVPGPDLGRLLHRLAELEEKGIVSSAQEARREAASGIVLFHLTREPAGFLEHLRARGTLGAILPEIAPLEGLEQTGPHHREDAYRHTRQVIEALPAGSSAELRMAAVFHDAGKATTRSFDPERGRFRFIGHEKESCRLFDEACRRFHWSDDDLDVREVTWLIANHVRLYQGPSDERGRLAYLDRLLFGAVDAEIPARYRDNLIALGRADIAGAEPATEEPRAERLAQHAEVVTLVIRIARERAGRSEDDLLASRVKAVWNGATVLQHFSVSGPEVGRLVRLGQDFAREQLAGGADAISTEEVRDWVSRRRAE